MKNKILVGTLVLILISFIFVSLFRGSYANVEEDNSLTFKSRLYDIDSFQTEDEKIKLIKELNKDNIIENFILYSLTLKL